MFGTAYQLVWQTVSEWSQDDVPQLGAALAFYTALSIAPLLVIALGVAALAFGAVAARGRLTDELSSLVGEHGGVALEEMIASANEPTTGSVAALMSFATLVFGASGVFGQLQSSMNAIWGAKPKPNLGIWGFLRARFLSIAMVWGTAFLLLASLLVSAGLGAVTSKLEGQAWPWVAQAVHFLVSFAVVTVLFAMIFKFLPDVRIAWRDVWLGAIITGGLFNAGKFAIGAYLGHSTMASSYGVAGSFVVLLVWTYYSAQLVFFGAEFTQFFANRRGSRIEPAHAP